MAYEKITKGMMLMGYEQQSEESYCSFKVVINNCKETELYFKKTITKDEEKKECPYCEEKAVVYDGQDEAGNLNYICENCGEPQDD